MKYESLNNRKMTKGNVNFSEIQKTAQTLVHLLNPIVGEEEQESKEVDSFLGQSIVSFAHEHKCNARVIAMIQAACIFYCGKEDMTINEFVNNVPTSKVLTFRNVGLKTVHDLRTLLNDYNIIWK